MGDDTEPVWVLQGKPAGARAGWIWVKRHWSIAGACSGCGVGGSGLDPGRERSRVWVTVHAAPLCPQVLAEKRSLGSRDGPPHLVVVVLLHSRAAAHDSLHLLQSQDSVVVRADEGTAGGFALLCPRLKQRWRFVTAPAGEEALLSGWVLGSGTSGSPTNGGVLGAGDLHAVLDLAKVADSLLFLLDPVDGWDSAGDHCLSCLFAQGLPSYGEKCLGFLGIGDLLSW